MAAKPVVARCPKCDRPTLFRPHTKQECPHCGYRPEKVERVQVEETPAEEVKRIPFREFL